MKKGDLVDKDFDPFIDTAKKKSKNITIVDNERKNKKISKKGTFSVKSLDNLDKILLLMFACMAVITIFLGYKAFSFRKEYKDTVKSSIVIPVLGPNINSEISVDVSNMEKDEEKDYSFKVSNNKDNSINETEVSYNIFFSLPKNVEVELYKNDKIVKKLLSDNKENNIIDNKLGAKEEQVDVYTLKIKAIKKTKKDYLISIKVAS